MPEFVGEGDRRYTSHFESDGGFGAPDGCAKPAIGAVEARLWRTSTAPICTNFAPIRIGAIAGYP
ncbi:MAG TPA: hypothetical protein V6C78_01455 [Crinalium sp.]